MSHDETSAREYWDSVESIAEEALAHADSDGDASDFIHESVDGSWWLIYGHASRAVMQHTENDDAYFEVFGSNLADLGPVESFQDIVTRFAFWAMRADVENRYARLKEEKEEERENEEWTEQDDADFKTLSAVKDAESRKGLAEMRARRARVRERDMLCQRCGEAKGEPHADSCPEHPGRVDYIDTIADEDTHDADTEDNESEEE